MGESIDRLQVKLARVNVKSYVRRVNGKTQHVSQYDYRRQGSAAPLESGAGKPVDRRAVDKIREGLNERAKINVEGRKAGDKPRKKAAAPKPKAAPKAALPEGVKSGKGTKDDPFVTGDPEVAARLIWEDDQTDEEEARYVRLEQKEQVSTLLDGLRDIVDDAKKKGNKAPLYNLCKVSVSGTNLFCTESKDIPRIKMPQLSGKPRPGSKADLLPKDAKGEVNLSEDFAKHLASKGFKIEEDDIDAKFLKASQNELNGGKVAGMVRAMEAGTLPVDAARIWVSGDDYVIDGHHRWAAAVGVEISTNTSVEIPVRRVKTDIITILAEANRWTVEMGINQAGA